MINRSRYKKLMAMTPGAQWWEKRYIASGYTRYDGSPANRQEVLSLIEWAIKRHQDIDREEERSNRDNPIRRRRQTGRHPQQ